MPAGGRVSVHNRSKKTENLLAQYTLFFNLAVVKPQSIATITRMEDRRGGDIWQAVFHLFSCSFHLLVFLFLSVSVRQRVPLVQRTTNRRVGRQSLSTQRWSLASPMQLSEECTSVWVSILYDMTMNPIFVFLKKKEKEKRYGSFSAFSASSVQLRLYCSTKPQIDASGYVFLHYLFMVFLFSVVLWAFFYCLLSAGVVCSYVLKGCGVQDKLLHGDSKISML